MQLPHNTQRFLSIAAVVGPDFDVKVVSSFLERTDESLSDTRDSRSTAMADQPRHVWVAGLQVALSQTMIVNVSFAHA